MHPVVKKILQTNTTGQTMIKLMDHFTDMTQYDRLSTLPVKFLQRMA